jgi:phosphoribosylaminoimidazole-succinocarboxamide synthase
MCPVGHSHHSISSLFATISKTLDWDKKPPAPAIPPDVAKATTARYVEAYRLLAGKEL